MVGLCPKCGQKTNFAQNKCEHCGVEVKFCNKCGNVMQSSETVCERDYSEDEINRALSNSGFEVLAVLGDMSMQAPKENADRVYYVARKR